MLDADDIADHLNRLTLPTGMTATVTDDPWEGVKVRILYRVPDSFDPDRMIDLGIDSYLSPNDRVDVAALERWITWRVWRIFGHEAREQVQRGGFPLDDPHASER